MKGRRPTFGNYWDAQGQRRAVQVGVKVHDPDMGSRSLGAKAEAGLPIMVPPVEMIASPLVILAKRSIQLRRMHDNLILDVVTVTRLDRLAQSTCDLFAIVKQERPSAIPFIGRAVGRHRHQHRAADDCRSRRTGRLSSATYEHPHRRGPQPGAEARAAHGPTFETHGSPED
jgi:hypothetical protein